MNDNKIIFDFWAALFNKKNVKVIFYLTLSLNLLPGNHRRETYWQYDDDALYYQ